MDRRTKTPIRAVGITDFWHRLVDHGISETKVEGQPTQVLIDLSKQKSFRFNEWNCTLRNQNRKLWTFNQFPDLSQFIDTELFGWRGTWIPLKRPLLHHQKCIFLIFLLSLPQRNLWVFTRVALNLGRGNNFTFRWPSEIFSELTLIVEDLKPSCSSPVQRSGDQWCPGSNLFQCVPTGPQNPPRGHFASCSEMQSCHICTEWLVESLHGLCNPQSENCCDRNDRVEANRTMSTNENIKLYWYINQNPRALIEINATFEVMKDAGVDSCHILIRLTYLTSIEDRSENGRY